MWNWIGEHQMIFWLIGAASLAIFLITLFTLPAIIVRIRPDYFAHEKRPPSRWVNCSAPVRGVILVAKNVLGFVLIAMGMVMLGLPGQGTLTMLVGFLLIDFPGKYRVECWLVRRRSVARPINWLRHRAGREPMVLE